MKVCANEPLTILVVDDNAANLIAFEAILSTLGQRIVTAASGEAALRRVLDHDFAVVLLDVQMPEMNGFEVAARIHSHAHLASLPIIFVTAIDRDSTQVFNGYAHGAVDYVLKPIEPEILRAKIRVFLQLRRNEQMIREQAHRLHMHEVRELERRAQQRFRGLTESMPLPIWGVRPDGVVYMCNRSWTSYSGLSADETGTVATTPSLHPDDVERVGAQWSDGVSRGEPFDFECRLRQERDGAFRWHLLRAVPERGDPSYESYWVVAGLDIDVQKEAGNERLRLLEEAQRSRAEAEAANRSKDEFLATLSHELRTPLGAILGWAHIARTGPMSAQRGAIEAIERSARAQARLIDDLLDVSRVVTGKLRIQAGSLDLRTIVGSAVETMRPAAQAKQIDLLWQPSPSGAPYVGDADRLEQVVWNLVSNAVKFTPNGGQVRLTLDRDGECARISVTDDGPGIDADLLPHVFERLRQGNGPATRRQQGLGLGLSIVKSIVELHGGQVTAESRVGEGATFVVTLPSVSGAAGNGSEPRGESL